MEQEKERDTNGGFSINLVALPIEILVYILSFLTSVSRELAKMRYVCRKFRSVCETPSLWRRFSWSQFDVREERCVKNVLKMYGEHVRRLSFSHHVMPAKLIAMLKCCSNLVQLSIPNSKLSTDLLGKAIESMRNLENLDVLWYYGDDISPLLLISARLKELTIREKSTCGHSISYSALHVWMDNWVKEGFHPQTLNVVSLVNIPSRKLIEQWVLSNPSSPPGHTGYLNMYCSLKAPMDLYPALPEFQLQFGQSCSLPYVKASNCGLLGLENDLLLLTSCSDGDNVLYRARMVMLSNINEGGHLKSDMTSLTFVTHFDASFCKSLHSGHLEQLAIMCPNLSQLNLKGNRNCLKSLQGLRVIATCGKLQCLNLLGISFEQLEDRVQLWEILVNLRLLYLAIEACVLLPFRKDDHARLMGLYQKCSNLRGLESYRGAWSCIDCRIIVGGQSSSLLSNFPLLTHCFTTDVQRTTLQDVLSSCRNLKCLRYSDSQSLHLSQNCTTLEQLCIDSMKISIPDSFMDTISVHGRLVHVILFVYAVTTDGITTLIANSPRLETCHIDTYFIRTPEGGLLNRSDYSQTLKRKFSYRKLFTCGSCYLVQGQTQGKSSFFHRQNTVNYVLFDRNTDLTSLLP